MVNPLSFIRSSRKKQPDPDPDADANSAAAAPSADIAEAAAVEPIAAPPAVAPESAVVDEEHTHTLRPQQPHVDDLVDASDARTVVMAGARAIYAEALQAVGRFFSAARDAGEQAEAISIADIDVVVNKLIGGMAEDQVSDALVALAVGGYPDEGRFIVPHSVNVAVLSQRVARQLGLEGQELITLGVAAMVHDVGTVRIPKETFYKADSLTNDEWELMRSRPTFSSEIINQLGDGYRAVAEIAHQVHERLDGNGYPRALTVDSIALEASILGAVDIFEAFIHPRPYKKTVPAAAMYGVDNLMRMSHQFGDGVLKALVRSVGLFPVGTFVRLNSGEIARVMRGRSANPMRPEVEVLLDNQKRRLSTTRYVDLMATPHLYIFKPLSPEDLEQFDL